MSVKLETIIMGDTIRVDAAITDYDGAAYNPTTQSIQMYNPRGAASGGALTSPTKISDGHYNQEVSIPAAGAGIISGRWYIRWSATVGGKISTDEIFFDVKA